MASAGANSSQLQTGQAQGKAAWSSSQAPWASGGATAKAQPAGHAPEHAGPRPADARGASEQKHGPAVPPPSLLKVGDHRASIMTSMGRPVAQRAPTQGTTLVNLRPVVGGSAAVGTAEGEANVAPAPSTDVLAPSAAVPNDHSTATNGSAGHAPPAVTVSNEPPRGSQPSSETSTAQGAGARPEAVHTSAADQHAASSGGATAAAAAGAAPKPAGVWGAGRSLASVIVSTPAVATPPAKPVKAPLAATAASGGAGASQVAEPRPTYPELRGEAATAAEQSGRLGGPDAAQQSHGQAGHSQAAAVDQRQQQVAPVSPVHPQASTSAVSAAQASPQVKSFAAALAK